MQWFEKTGRKVYLLFRLLYEHEELFDLTTSPRIRPKMVVGAVDNYISSPHLKENLLQ